MDHPRLNQLTFSRLILAFTTTRGGWIALSFVWAAILRSTILKFSDVDLLLIVSIVIAWPFLEWVFHRYLMHEWTLLPIHGTHAYHHRHPTSETGLPDRWIVASYFIVASVLWGFGWRYLLTVAVAILAMLLVYEFVHFSCHCNYKPLTSWGWAVRINHLQHHNLDESKQYSMLFPWTIKRRA
jgi:hypothetical protein